MLIVTDARDAVCAVEWEDHLPRLNTLLRRYHGVTADGLVGRRRPSEAALALRAYFAGESGAIDGIEVATAGTEFQQTVWRALRAIPPGRPISYGELARRIGRPKAVRAVGFANGANPISVIIPCHRLVGADGSLTGYGGGLARKRWLLDHEAARH